MSDSINNILGPHFIFYNTSNDRGYKVFTYQVKYEGVGDDNISKNSNRFKFVGLKQDELTKYGLASLCIHDEYLGMRIEIYSNDEKNAYENLKREKVCLIQET